jgi:hypothetical protein
MVILAFSSFAQAREEARVMSRQSPLTRPFPFPERSRLHLPAQAADWRAAKYAMFSLATLSIS